MPYDIVTMNLGVCAQVSAFLVAGGTPGKRFALPNASFVMQNPVLYPDFDEKGNPVQSPMVASDIKVEVEQVLREKRVMLEGFSGFTGRSMLELEKDFSRDFYLTADESKEYGLVDNILVPKRARDSDGL